MTSFRSKAEALATKRPPSSLTECSYSSKGNLDMHQAHEKQKTLKQRDV